LEFWKSNVPFVDTSILRIAYEDLNPQGHHAVVLMHGWPDNPRTWKDVAPVLTQAGYRVLIPTLRGFAPTTFLRGDTPRTGQLVALGRDLLEFIDALGLQSPALVGHDWGARAVAIANGLRPGISSHMVMISVGYGTNDPHQPISVAQARNYWYHWYMNTPKGRVAVDKDRMAFTRMMWDLWAPEGWYEQAEFEETAKAFDNPDWTDVVVHSYTHRWGLSPADPAYAADERMVQPAPVLSVPTLVLHGEADGVNFPDSSANKEPFFSGRYQRTLLPGVGHFPQREAPQAVAQAVLDWLKLS
jgi:pimeloyl-ACP methyl ester carboxylesterase